MDTIQNILTRRSVRTYDASPISKEDLHTILTAGMSGPVASMPVTGSLSL